jgi:hypothetical protein
LHDGARHALSDFVAVHFVEKAMGADMYYTQHFIGVLEGSVSWDGRYPLAVRMLCAYGIFGVVVM